MCNKCKLHWLIDQGIFVPPHSETSMAEAATDVFELMDRNHTGDDIEASMVSLRADLETIPLGDLFILAAKAGSLQNFFSFAENQLLRVLSDRVVTDYAAELVDYKKEPRPEDGIREMLKQMGMDLPEDAEIKEIRLQRPDDE